MEDIVLSRPGGSVLCFALELMMDVLPLNGVAAGGAANEVPVGVLSSADNRAEPAPTRAGDNVTLPSPPEPSTLMESGLPKSELEALVLKILLQRGTCTGSVI